MRFIEFLILLLVIFISCEKEEPLPLLNGTYNGYVTEYYCPIKDFVRPPCEWTPIEGGFSANGECSLTFKDNRYHLKIDAILTYQKTTLEDYYEAQETIVFWSKEILVDEKGTFKNIIQLGPETETYSTFLGYNTRKLPKHYTGRVTFYPKDKEQYTNPYSTLRNLEIYYLVDIEPTEFYLGSYEVCSGKCSKIRTEYKIVLNFDSDCWDSFLEF